MATSEDKEKAKKRKRNEDDGSKELDNGGEKFTFFFGADSPFSQWHPAKFEVDGVTYNCAEQYMMYQKAVLFDDKTIADQIMATDIPRSQKALGRKVSNFSEKKWKANCRAIVKKGNMAKFSQNSDLGTALLKTTGTTLAEAAPRDTMWGIGLSSKSWKAQHREHWRGENLLGEILTEVRDELSAAKEDGSAQAKKSA